MVKSRAPVTPAISRAPKQDRSRASFERVLDAAAGLLAEKGYAGFTLGDVVTRARVSIGAIYGRVSGKDELIRAVQHREFARIELEQTNMFLRIRRRAVPMDQLIRLLIEEIAQLMQRNGPLLNAFMERANQDKQVQAFGKQAFSHSMLEFKMVLLERSGDFAAQDAEHAAAVCFDVIYSSLARYFGVGRFPSEKEPGELSDRVADLADVCLAYLSLGKKGRRRP
jgi:AcrR family transcriptional regulator